MSDYTPTFTETFDFEGDKVTVTMSRLKRKDFMSLAPYMTVDEKGAVKMTFANQQEFLDAVAEMIPKYVKVFEGLKDSANLPIEISTVMEELYFLDLVTEISGALFAASNLKGEEDIKN